METGGEGQLVESSGCQVLEIPVEIEKLLECGYQRTQTGKTGGGGL